MPAFSKEFERDRLLIRSLVERKSDLDLGVILPLKEKTPIPSALKEIAQRILQASGKKGAVILMMGGHVIRSGVQRYVLDMMEQGLLSCLAVNGAVMIHDFEFALRGETTESVARYVREGKFGLWEETGTINEIIHQAYSLGLGMGEGVGRAILEGDFPYKSLSLLAAAYRLQIPLTVHVGIGYDIIHEHPNCDGAATGATSYRDFLRLAKIVEDLEGGVVMNFGSAVMAPEVFLKALSMARNVAYQHGRTISKFSTLVCDLYPIPEDFSQEASKEDPAYYFRPWKTMLIRTVADGGQSFYVQGPHDQTIPALWTALRTLGMAGE